jgi:hypothetical protein
VQRRDIQEVPRPFVLVPHDAENFEMLTAGRKGTVRFDKFEVDLGMKLNRLLILVLPCRHDGWLCQS